MADTSNFRHEGIKYGMKDAYARKELVKKITAPATAKLGQTIKVSKVDDADFPVEWEASDFSGGLVAKYVHSGNKVIRPTALDLTTGVFTCVGHGLTDGDSAMVINDDSFHYIPSELILNSTLSTNTLKIRVVDADTFVLQYAGSDIVYTASINTTVDVTKWHIEISMPGEYIIEGFSVESAEVRISGHFWGTSNYSLRIYPMADGDHDTLLPSLCGTSTYGGPRPDNTSRICPFTSGTIHLGSMVEYRMFTFMPSSNEADYIYLQRYPGNIDFGMQSRGVVCEKMHPLKPHNKITAILLCSSNFGSNRTVMLANGFTVEVYRRG